MRVMPRRTLRALCTDLRMGRWEERGGVCWSMARTLYVLQVGQVSDRSCEETQQQQQGWSVTSVNTNECTVAIHRTPDDAIYPDIYPLQRHLVSTISASTSHWV